MTPRTITLVIKEKPGSGTTAPGFEIEFDIDPPLIDNEISEPVIITACLRVVNVMAQSLGTVPLNCFAIA